MDLAELAWGDLGTGGLAALAIVAILLGWLVPRKILTDRIRDKDAEIQRIGLERDNWRAAAQAKDQTIATLVGQLDEALESARTAKSVLEALSKAAGHG